MPAQAEAGPQIEYLDYRCRGCLTALWSARDREILVEGPAGTGKSRAVAERIAGLCEDHPNIRVMAVRKTRASITDSICRLLEDNVLPPGHPALQGPSREHRTRYVWPNGSQIILRGLDVVTRTFSDESDVVWVEEGKELNEDEYEQLHRLLRHNVLPWQQVIVSTNPDAPQHWLNRRAERGKMRRLLSRHTDNPSVTPEYLATLDSMSGVRRQRLFLGLWVAAEGQIWECFDPAVHIVPASAVPPLKRYVAGVDFGFAKPGCILVGGVDKDDRVWIVAEVYAREKSGDWWAEQAEKLHREYKIERWACDSADPEMIQKFNDRLGPIYKRDAAPVAVKANKSVSAGLDVVRDRLDNLRGGARLFFVEGRGRYFDSGLDSEHKPTSVTDEIPSYVFRRLKEGGTVKDEPDPEAEDHGCDALRYLCMDWWAGNPNAYDVPAEKYPKGSAGDFLEHQKVWDGTARRARLQREGRWARSR